MKRPTLLTATCPVASLLTLSLSSTVSARTACDTTLTKGSIARLNPTRATVDKSMLIDACWSEVWTTLTDFDNMARWSIGTLSRHDRRHPGWRQSVDHSIFELDKNGQRYSTEFPLRLIYDEGRAFVWSVPYTQGHRRRP